jgi:glycerol-3-phosphate dehydrogenase
MLMLTGGPIITFRIIGNDLADAVAQRLAPSGEPRMLSYRASGFSAKLEGFDPTASPGRIPDDLLREIAREEQVLNLEDLCLRRTKLGYEHDQGFDDIEKTAEAVAGVLGWDQQRTRHEVEKYRDTIRRIFPNFRND